jgi:hypothetical protein
VKKGNASTKKVPLKKTAPSTGQHRRSTSPTPEPSASNGECGGGSTFGDQPRGGVTGSAGAESCAPACHKPPSNMSPRSDHDIQACRRHAGRQLFQQVVLPNVTLYQLTTVLTCTVWPPILECSAKMHQRERESKTVPSGSAVANCAPCCSADLPRDCLAPASEMLCSGCSEVERRMPVGRL